MLSVYPAFFCEEENGYSVIFPDLNGLSTCGDTREGAMERAVECLAGYLYECKREGEDVPAPSVMCDVEISAYLRDLYEDSPVPHYYVNLVSVDADLYAKEYFEKSVKKTLSIPAWLNKAALEQGINFSQVLQEALLNKLQKKR